MISLCFICFKFFYPLFFFKKFHAILSPLPFSSLFTSLLRVGTRIKPPGQKGKHTTNQHIYLSYSQTFVPKNGLKTDPVIRF